MTALRPLAAAAVLLGASLGARDAFAYRPFDGTDADVAGLGDFEAEIGPVQLYSVATAGYLVTPAATLNLGFAPRWELVTDFSNYLGPASGVTEQLLDTDVLTKVIVVPGSLQGAGTGPALAVEFGTLLPNVHGETGFGGSLNAIVSERWTWLTVHANTWFQLTRGTLHPDWFEGVIVEGNIDAPLRPVSEWFVERELVTGAMTYSGLVGGIWRAREGLDLDMALREASVDGQRVSEVRLGFTWTLGVWGDARDARP